MNRKYMIDTEENRAFLREQAEILLNFGHRFPSETGASYFLGDDGTPWTDRPRETWITCRMAHVYGIGAALGHKGSEELIDKAVNGLLTALKDNEYGGWYPGINPDGTKMKEKQAYAHAFVMLAGSTAVLLNRPRGKELLEEAKRVFDEYYWNEKEGMSCDTWNTEFTELDSYRGINANMHSVEAFLAVADATGDEKYRIRAGRIVNRVLSFAENNNWRTPEHFSDTWIPLYGFNSDKRDDRFKPYGATPGHGIEWSRLTCQWATSSLTREDQIPYIEKAEKLYRQAIKDGWYADGEPGIVYTTDWNGLPVVHDRMHWTLAEAINSSAVLYHLTGKKEYAEDYAMFMQYLDEKVIDHINGSWFHQLDRNNRVIGTVWPGKSDLYHAFQAMLIPYYPHDVSIASAVVRGRK